MKRIEKLKNSTFSRGLFAAKSAMRMIPSMISGEEDPRKLLKDFIGKSIDQFVNDVGELKGSLLKSAQILSLYGEYYLPPEVNEILKKVQSQGHFLGWDKVKGLIPDHFHRELEIEEVPLAAASIGQVHRAKIKKTGDEIVLKIQYPGIKKAIDLDIRMIKSFLSVGKILPSKMNLDGIYGEIKRVLLEEMDYGAEARKHAEYKTLMAPMPHIYVPKIFPEFCTEEVIASEFIAGHPFSELEKLNLTQDEKNEMGRTFFSLFFKEIFHGRLIQTDCHGGNYLYRKNELVLIDFGACLDYPEKTMTSYRDLITHVFRKDRDAFFRVLRSVVEIIQFDENLLWEYCLMVSSPLQSEDFDWGATRLPDEISPTAIELVKTSKIETPPHDFIFLDRKLLGLFSILRLLNARFNVKAVVEEYLPVEASV